MWYETLWFIGEHPIISIIMVILLFEGADGLLKTTRSFFRGWK